MHSAAIAPIRGLRDVLGALTLGRAQRHDAFTPADLPLLEDLTRRAGLALDNARLYQRQRKVAETMQRHLLPQLPVLPGLEMTARYVPAPDASSVGGDWYDAFALAFHAHALVIGDVVGHDLDAAAGMAQVRNMLRAFAWSHPEATPSAVVTQLDEAVMHIAEVPMATMILARLTLGDDTLWRLTWTNALPPAAPAHYPRRSDPLPRRGSRHTPRHRSHQTSPRRRHRPATPGHASALHRRTGRIPAPLHRSWAGPAAPTRGLPRPPPPRLILRLAAGPGPPQRQRRRRRHDRVAYPPSV